MKYKINLLYVITLLLFAFTACKKQEVQQITTEQSPKVDESKIQYKPQTQEEMQLVENLAKLTNVMKVVYADKQNVLVVNAAVYAKVYTDESVLVKDLIYPDQSRLTNSKRFKEAVRKHNLSLSKFASDFWKAAEKNNDAAF